MKSAIQARVDGLSDSDRQGWEEVLAEAERDERLAERALARLKDERTQWMKDWNRRREEAKQELRDVLKVKRSAAYALKTGREPK